MDLGGNARLENLADVNADRQEVKVEVRNRECRVVGDADLFHLTGDVDGVLQLQTAQAANDRAGSSGKTAHAGALNDAAVTDPGQLILLGELRGGITTLHHRCGSGEPLVVAETCNLDTELYAVAADCGDHRGVLGADSRQHCTAACALTDAVEEAGRLDNVVERIQDLLTVEALELEQLGQDLLIEEQVGSRLTGVVFIAHLEALCEDRLDSETAHLLEDGAHHREELIAHAAQIVCNLLGVQTPAAETALVRTLCREVCGNLAGCSVLDDEHCNALGDDTGTCADRVGVERGHDLDLAGLDQFDGILIGLCPVLEAASAD